MDLSLRHFPANRFSHDARGKAPVQRGPLSLAEVQGGIGREEGAARPGKVCDPVQRAVDRRSRQVHRHSFPKPYRRGRRIEPGRQERITHGLALEVHGERVMGAWVRRGACEPPALDAMSTRTVDLEDGTGGELGHTPRARIEPSTEKNDLGRMVAQCGAEGFVDGGRTQGQVGGQLARDDGKGAVEGVSEPGAGLGEGDDPGEGAGDELSGERVMNDAQGWRGAIVRCAQRCDTNGSDRGTGGHGREFRVPVDPSWGAQVARVASSLWLSLSLGEWAPQDSMSASSSADAG